MKLSDMFINSYQNIKIYQKNKIFLYNDLFLEIKRMITYLKQSGISRGSSLLVYMEHDVVGISFLIAASIMGLQVCINYNLEFQTDLELENMVLSISDRPIVILNKNRLKENNLIKLKNKTKIIELWKSKSIPNPISDIKAVETIKNFLVIFTSGTSGIPKAISVSEDTICKRIILVTKKLEFTKNSVIFMSGLLSNTTGIIFSFGAFLNNSKLVIPVERNVKKWIRIIEKYKVTHIMLRPAILEIFIKEVLNKQLKLGSLHIIAYGAAAVSENIIDTGRKILTCKWIQGYGLSETFGPFIWLDEEAHNNYKYKEEKYCIGVSDESLRTRIIPLKKGSNYGELEVSGDIMMNGYLNDEKNFTSTWFKTGDLVIQKNNGYFYIKGRIKNTILTQNGHCVYPEEIEALIKEINTISDCFLCAPSVSGNIEIFGTVLCVFTKETFFKNVINAIINRLEENFSKEKWPDWVFCSNHIFPRNINEKVLKHKIAKSIKLQDLFKVKKE